MRFVEGWLARHRALVRWAWIGMLLILAACNNDNTGGDGGGGVPGY